MSDDLRSIIESAAAELNPETDNQEAETPTEAPVEEYAVDDTEEILEEGDEDTDDEEVEESDEVEAEEDDEAEESDSDGELYTVKVDGETFQVTEEELKAGYQRQADYTREKQALKASIDEFETVREQFVQQISALEELDAAWDESPIAVLAHFAVNTGNPTTAVANLIRELAASNQLDKQFMEMFGITPEIQREWATEAELNQLRSRNAKVSSDEESELNEVRMELEIQKAIAEYENQIDDIIESEGLNFNVKQRADFRKQLAAYAADNELTNLKAAYKAFKYEEAQSKKALAAKTVERAKAKKATKVVSRSGAGEGNPIQDTTDLSAIIRASLKDVSGN